MVNQEKGYVVFTEEMKKTHTILVPNMLPMHFKMISKVMGRSGYRMELPGDQRSSDRGDWPQIRT